jgi:hypothetical protein
LGSVRDSALERGFSGAFDFVKISIAVFIGLLYDRGEDASTLFVHVGFHFGKITGELLDCLKYCIA